MRALVWFSSRFLDAVNWVSVGGIKDGDGYGGSAGVCSRVCGHPALAG